MHGSGDSGVDETRRRLIAAVASGSTGAFAGCGSSFGSGGTDQAGTDEQSTEATPAQTSRATSSSTPTAAPTATASPTPSPTPTPTPEPPVVAEDFEGGYEDSFTDASQPDVTPAITSAHAAEGEQSLQLASTPGTSSANAVRSIDATTAPLSVSTETKLVTVAGPECAVSITLVDADSDARVGLRNSWYHNTVPELVEVDERGEQVQKHVLGQAVTLEEWTDVGLRVDGAESVAASVNQATVTANPALDWTGRDFHLELTANAWGSGHAVTAAFDAVEFDEQ